MIHSSCLLAIVSSLRIVTYRQGLVFHLQRLVVQGELFALFILLSRPFRLFLDLCLHVPCIFAVAEAPNFMVHMVLVLGIKIEKRSIHSHAIATMMLLW